MKSLAEIICTRAIELPDREVYTFLIDGEREKTTLSYRELELRARAIAAQLQMLCEPGARALLLFSPGLEYSAAFCGCLYAGVIAVPAYPPRMNRNLERLQAIVKDSEAAVALTSTAILAHMKPALTQDHALHNLHWITTDEVPLDSADMWRMPDLNHETLALLQYTSGSTGTPKGVMVTHGNLLSNELLIQRAFRQTQDSIIVGWLPLYHDMGLIGNVLQPMYTGSRCVLMSHVAFLQRPARWLEAISCYRATTSGGPNFAYDLCTRKITADERMTLDLSSWTTAFNGSEPVRADTLKRFSETFKSCGFDASAFYPCYGLAEATLFVSGSPEPRVPQVKSFAAQPLEQNRIVEADAHDDAATSLVGCGTTSVPQRLVIINPETSSLCRPNEVGEIWIAGESVAAGYWKRPEETKQTFGACLQGTPGSFLRTGDLGFIHQGELFVTGRLKDLIIIRGRNLYPQDIERTVQQSHPKLESAVGAAFSIDVDNEERLIVVQETQRSASVNYVEILSAIREAIAEEYAIQLYAVVVVKHGGVPRTSSGKIQRRACRQMFVSNRLDSLAEWRESATAPRDAPVVMPAGRSVEEIENWMCAQLAAKIGVDVSDIDIEKSITHYGIDSVATVELMHAIETGLGIVVPFSSFYRSPSIREIAREAANQSSRQGEDQRSRRLNRWPRITTAIPRQSE